MTYLLDSDILIYYFKKKDPVIEMVERLLNSSDVVISAITFTEVRAGWSDDQAKEWLPVVKDLLPVIEVSFAIAEHAGYQIKTSSQRGRTGTTTDGIIVATALLNGFCLVT